jgi:hypothetical protein
MKVKYTFLAIIACMTSCSNFDREFPDFDYTTCYFPYQYPVRTIILGNYIYDNSNDNNHIFVISAAMGGVYANDKDRTVDFTVDESLCDNAWFSYDDHVPVLPLPSQYYQLSNASRIVIPAGKVNGGVEVQLSDEFFNDPLAYSNNFVIPLRITGVSNLDSVLTGNAVAAGADPRIASEWAVAPKHFTMFGVKFVNPWHGSYLHYGSAEVREGDAVVEDSVYSAKYVEQNEVLSLTTVGKTSVVSSGIVLKSKLLTGAVAIRLNFSSDDYSSDGGVTCTVESASESGFTVSGSGKYVMNAEEYGGKKRDAIYLNYTVSNGAATYTAADTFVFRDKGINLETYTPEIVK